MAAPDYLITTALPYANGPTHLGHLVEHIQADIWVRFLKLKGHSCLYLSGDDAHGTPVMLQAEKKGSTPEVMIAEIHQERIRDFQAFDIAHDHYHTTHSEENKKASEIVYQALDRADLIEKKEINQLFDEKKGMFLPDRYVKGTCPHCKTPDQYGDHCEHCGKTYQPTELLDPYSTLTQTTPILKTSVHHFFRLPKTASSIQKWLESAELHPSVYNKLQEWFTLGLKDWDISRDAPYFGFAIPGTVDKFFYVWLDAPIGYIGITDHYIKTHHPDYSLEDLWKKEAPQKIYHFIGKDIIYFHGLFWPAMLESSDHRTPNGIFAHGFLTVNGRKMSKSRGTFITAQAYIDHLDPNHFRYFLASKLSDGIEDIDLSWQEYCDKIHADLIGKFINIPSRCSKIIHKYFEGHLSDQQEMTPLLAHCLQASDDIQEAYQSRKFAKAVRLMMALTDTINQKLTEEAPWTQAKQGQLAQAQAICTEALYAFLIVTHYITPILPSISEKICAMFHCSINAWPQGLPKLQSTKIAPYTHLMQRIDPKSIEALNHGQN